MKLTQKVARLLLIVLLFVFFLPGAVPGASPNNTPPDGFRALFNGKDLAGWKGLVGKPHERAAMSEEKLAANQKKADQQMRAHWTVENGELVYDGKGNNLCTDTDYADFELYLDWKIKEKGDSGIYLRGLPQVQIWDPKLSNVGSGGLYNNKQNSSKPLVVADNPIGEWNTFYIKMVGSQVTIRLNGQLVVDNVVLENLWQPNIPVFASGQIELQHHGNTLWFRNLYIRELTTSEELTKIQHALPEKARVEPDQPHQLLVFTRAAGYRHQSIPHGAHAIQLMGQATGAYNAVITDDLTQFTPENLRKFDAVLLCNTTGKWIQPTAADLKKLAPDGGQDANAVEHQLRQGLLDFVAGGKGLMGFHSASDANYHWPEFGQMLGGYFNHHPWHEKVGIRVERPDHPLSSAFNGSDFSIVDEIYQFRDPYSRDNLQVLLSLDPEKTDLTKGNIERTDNDFAVAWVRQQGKGRVFYSSLGHRPEIFWNPMIMQFYLDGLQYVLGDLEANATPSARLKDGS